MEQQAATHPKAVNAALMVLLMEEGEASTLLARLSPKELQLLGEHMCDLGEVAPEQIAGAIADFANQAETRGLPDEDRRDRVHGLMANAVGPIRADSLMRKILPEDNGPDPKALEIAQWLEPQVMLTLIVDELPQTIAVLLVQLDPQIAAQILAILPDALQADVVQRIATLGAISPLATGMLEDLLDARIKERYGDLPITMGGVREAAELINQAGGAFEKRVMPAINKRDKKLAKELETEMFRFEHLYVLDTQMMGQLLREVDSETLIDSLKGIGEDQRDVFFGAMSSRAADGLKDEIEGRGRLKFAEVQAAQAKIIAVARKLAADGTLSFGDDGGDEDYV